jgi:hypothetical protein
MKLDVVYTWVDPTNSEWLLERNQYIQPRLLYDSSTGVSRYESFDEIRYSLRSLFKYCDFVDRVFIVSNNGSKPEWLKRNGNIVIIDDRSIFPDDRMVPNYNSNAIESCIYRIPGLSEYFIYMNDDFFITKRLSIDDLIDLATKRCSVFVETDPVITAYDKYLSPFLSNMIQLAGGTGRARKYTYKKIALDCPNDFLIGHCCRIYDKRLITEFEKTFISEIDKTRHQRFRTTESFCFCDAYAFYFAQLNRVNPKYSHKTKLLLFTDHAIINNLQITRALKCLAEYHFLAILDIRTKVNHDNVCRVQQFLEQLFPDKGDFEL